MTALCGAPIAQEDHAIRALHAALDIKEVFTAYADELQRTQAITLDVGMGVATGMVAVGMRQNDTCVDYTGACRQVFAC